MKAKYPCIVEPQEPSGFFVQFVDFEEAFTEGETLEKALFNASEVLAGIIEWRVGNKIDVPLPSPLKPGQYAVAPRL